jgi:3-oxoacyl-[acyl-carrier-protein] synthase III
MVMARAVILGTGHSVPDRIVTNEELSTRMDTSDEWIQKRTGIQERRHVDFDQDPVGASDLAARASKAALDDAGVAVEDIDCIIYATLSSDKVFPGDGVLVQAKMNIPVGVPAFDVRNQCSGFLYGLQMAHAFIQQGLYRRILLIGAEVHSSGLDFTNQGRDVAVIFGDGGAAMVLGPQEGERGVLAVNVHADGRFSDVLHLSYPSSASRNRLDPSTLPDPSHIYPQMQGRLVFKHAATRMSESVTAILTQEGFTTDDIDLMIPHQANLRISEMVQRKLTLRDDQVFNNIQKYGNTTACSIPLAVDEARKEGRLKQGDLLCLVAFGAGFTWGSALIRV